MIGIKHNTIKIFDNSFTVAEEYLRLRNFSYERYLLSKKYT